MLNLKYIKDVLDRYGDALEFPASVMEMGGRVFDFAKSPALMGVINLSTDSAYTESICHTPEQAIARGKALMAAGADMVDLGAESSLPQAARISPSEQIEKLVPVVQGLAETGLLVSVESYYPEVLEKCAKAGAAVFNLTGAREEEAVFDLAAKYDAAIVLCYVQGQTVRDVNSYAFAEDMMGEMESHFKERIARAERLGANKLILDPGLGFYYRNMEDGNLRVNHQLQVFLHTFRLRSLGYPTLNILPHAPEFFKETFRRSAEPFFAFPALLGGSDIIRTHEVEAVSRVRAVMTAFKAR